jgi:osmotically inducible lipoprotein OsmB
MEVLMRRTLRMTTAAATLAVMSGCAGLDDDSGRRTLTGAGVGAGVGAGAGLLTGGVLGKTASGAAAGAAGGLLYDQYKKNNGDD